MPQPKILSRRLPRYFADNRPSPHAMLGLLYTVIGAGATDLTEHPPLEGGELEGEIDPPRKPRTRRTIFTYLLGRRIIAAQPQPTPESTDALPMSVSPLLQIPAELRLLVFKNFFDDVFHRCDIISDFGGKLNDLYVTEPPARLEPWTSILLINRLLHDEAEEVLWRHSRLTLDVDHHYKYPIRPSPILHLSAYAYSTLKYLSLELKVDETLRFSYIKTEYSGFIGRYLSRTSGTWRFSELARQLTNLKHATFRILDRYPGIPKVNSRYRTRVIDVLLSIIGSFTAEDITVVTYNNDALHDALLERLKYRVRVRKFRKGIYSKDGDEGPLDRYAFI